MHDGETLLTVFDTFEGETHNKQALTSLLVGNSRILSIGILHGGESGLDGLQDIYRSGCVMVGIKLVPIVERDTKTLHGAGVCLRTTSIAALQNASQGYR